jgi:hypothetical protein
MGLSFKPFEILMTQKINKNGKVLHIMILWKFLKTCKGYGLGYITG